MAKKDPLDDMTGTNDDNKPRGVRAPRKPGGGSSNKPGGKTTGSDSGGDSGNIWQQLWNAFTEEGDNKSYKLVKGPDNTRLVKGSGPTLPPGTLTHIGDADEAQKLLDANPYEKGTREYYLYIVGLPYKGMSTYYQEVLNPPREEAFKALGGPLGAFNPDAMQQFYRNETQDVAMIQGAPSKVTGSETVFNAIATQPEGVTEDIHDPSSHWLNQFAKGDNMSTGGSHDARVQYTEVLTHNGDYIYIGRVEDKYGGEGYTRPLYAYVDNASASVANLTEDEIKGYQAQLGLQQTGLVDPQLRDLWNEAVRIGSQYAQMGKQVELRFIFDSLVASTAAAGGLGGGGGGRGSRNKTDQDYYFMMMQVLGDISGVKS